MIGADQTGLPAGTYTGVVTLTVTGPAAVASGSVVTEVTTSDQAVIELTLNVLPTEISVVYLPLVIRLAQERYLAGHVTVAV